MAPSGTMIGAIVAIAFFLIFAATAYVAFRALKKTAKMAVRMIVVVITVKRRCSVRGHRSSRQWIWEESASVRRGGSSVLSI